MKTKVRKNDDIFVIDVEGNLNVEGVHHLKKLCYEGLKQKQILFNLASLDFVGSSGIAAFSDTLVSLKRDSEGFKICCVSSEFKKYFFTEGLAPDICSSEEEALSAFKSHQSK